MGSLECFDQDGTLLGDGKFLVEVGSSCCAKKGIGESIGRDDARSSGSHQKRC